MLAPERSTALTCQVDALPTNMSSPPSKDRSSFGTAPASAGGSDGPEIELDQRARYVAGDLFAGRYRLAKVLGEGGMGQVWLARNETLEIDVAVKLIRREVATPELAQRLLQEARAAARIGHPSIVRVFDFGETDYKDPFIVMEVLSGEALREALDRKGRLSAVNAVRMLLPVASALAAAHAKQIVHRDLKPENIVLTEDALGAILPKVVDFGIAKLREEDHGGRLTKVGVALGSPDYMSPEQARGKTDIDERSDVWALAVVLYECIAGAPPFSGPNYNALLSSIIEDPPRPLTEADERDEELWRIIEKGLAKSREERWPNMQAFGRALAEWALAQGVDVDVAGGSLVAHWIDGMKRPLSDPPPRPSGQHQRVSRPSTPVPSVPRLDAVWSNTGERRARDSIAESRQPPPARTSADPTPPRAPTPAGSPRRGRAFAGIAVAGIAIAAAAFFASRARFAGNTNAPTGEIDAAASAEPSAVAATTVAPTATPSSVATGTAPASPTVVETAVPSAAMTASASARVPWGACIASQFAPDAFATPPEVDPGSICSEVDPRKGAAALKKIVVLASSGARVTDAMGEWALLHWYEMAAFAVIRARCCADPKPLDLPPPIGTCEPLDRSLDALGAAAAGRGDVEAALARVRAAVQCTVTSGVAVDYNFNGRPPAGAESALRKTIARAAPAGR